MSCHFHSTAAKLVPLVNPSHLNGFEDSLVTSIRRAREIRDGHHPRTQVSEPQVHVVGAGVYFLEGDCNFSNVVPIHKRPAFFANLYSE